MTPVETFEQQVLRIGSEIFGVAGSEWDEHFLDFARALLADTEKVKLTSATALAKDLRMLSKEELGFAAANMIEHQQTEIDRLTKELAQAKAEALREAAQHIKRLVGGDGEVWVHEVEGILIRMADEIGDA